jgi:hypothetical protein
MIDHHPDDRFICPKLRGDVAVLPESESGTYVGSLLVEPKRHLEGLAELTEPEAERTGWLVSRLSRALSGYPEGVPGYASRRMAPGAARRA